MSGYFIIAGILLPTFLAAQPVLRMPEFFANWPIISMTFSVRCDGSWLYNFDKSHLRVFENGIEVTNYSLWCPDPGDFCTLAAALVMDASESMVGEKNRQAILAGKHFIDLMDGDKDEAALIWFNNVVTLRSPLTDDKAGLKTAMEELPAENLTSAWDGAYLGINHVVNNSTMPRECRAVILLTDGQDNNSTHTVDEVIAYAVNQMIRVFVISIGNKVNHVALNMLATQTGGKLFHTDDPIELTDIFERVFMESRSLHECELYYTSNCPDGTQREVEFRVENLCGGTTSMMHYYNAPLDSSVFEVGQFSVGALSSKEYSTGELPVYALSLPSGNVFPSGSMVLAYDTTRISFMNVSTGGTILEGTSIRWERVPEGVRLSWDDAAISENNGVLLLTYFRTGACDSAWCTDVDIRDFHFEHGCMKPMSSKGVVCCYTEPPDVYCTIQSVDSLRWDDASGNYLPNPFPVTYTITNVSSKPAKNVRYSITYNDKIMTLVQPVSAMQTGADADLEPQESESVTWWIQVNPQAEPTSVSVCITAHFDNREDKSCCFGTRIDPAPSNILCSLDAPVIVAQDALERYSPMPFQLSADVLNIGEHQKDSIWAEIYLSGEMKLFYGERRKKLVAAPLLPDSVRRVSWLLWHDPISDSAFVPVRVSIRSSDDDSSRCETVIVVPPLTAPVLDVQCTVPDELAFDEYTLTYSPNPFQASIHIENKGTKPATHVNAYLMLPSGVKFFGTEKARKDSPVDILKPGDAVDIIWELEYTDKNAKDKILDFHWSVGLDTEGGTALDSVYTDCSTSVPGIPPAFTCEVLAPDSVTFDEANGVINPNPVEIQGVFTNATVIAREITSVYATITSANATFDPGTPAYRLIYQTVQPGDTLSLMWNIVLTPSSVSQNVSITLKAIDESGIATYCQRTIYVPPSPLAITCTLDASSFVFAYDQWTGMYDPDSIVITTNVTNISGAPMPEVRVLLEVEGDTSYIRLDEDIPGNTWERTEATWNTHTTRTEAWTIRPQKINGGTSPEVLTFAVAYYDSERGWMRAGCSVTIVLEPEFTPGSVLECFIDAPDTVFFDDSVYVPTPVPVNVLVRNSGSLNAQNAAIYLLQDTRFTVQNNAVYQLAEIGAGKSDSIPSPFLLGVMPSHQDGYDTIRVLVLADDGLITLCEKPVFIQRTRAPEMFVECAADIDSIHFSDESMVFDPTQCILSAVIANTGESTAMDVECTAILPAGYQLLDSSGVYIGTMARGELRQVSWKVQPLCETALSVDTLRVIVHGTGGYGRALYAGECATVVVKEACGNPELQLQCSLPDTITCLSGGGVSPAPVLFEIQARNVTGAMQQPLTVTVQNFQGLKLVAGEHAGKILPQLLPGASTTMTWRFEPAQRNDTMMAQICVVAGSLQSPLSECCAMSVLLPEPETGFVIECSAPDSLIPGGFGEEYVNAPFPFCVNVQNTGKAVLDSVEIHFQSSGGMRLATAFDVTLYGPVQPGGYFPEYCWEVIPVPNTSTVPEYEWVQVSIFTEQSGSQVCRRDVYVPPVTPSDYVCSLLFSPADSIIGMREPQTVIATARIVKVDSISWIDMDAVMTLETPFAFASGETASKPLLASGLTGDTAEIQWELVSPVVYRDQTTHSSVVFIANEKTVTDCSQNILIRSVQPRVALHIPNDILGVYGRSFVLPVYIDWFDPVPMARYTLRIQFDPDIFKITGYSMRGAYAELGWDVSSYYPDNVNGIVEISGSAISGSSYLSTGAPLLYLLAEPVNEERRSEVAYYESVADILLEGEIEGAFVSEMTASVEGLERPVALSAEDGYVHITGDCIVALDAKHGYLLRTSPNPFNPSANVICVLPEDMYAKVRVYDVYGRVVQVLQDGWVSAGEHVFRFDAHTLEAGVYICTLETQDGIMTYKMILAK